MKRYLVALALVFASDSRAQPAAGGTVGGRVRTLQGRDEVSRDEVWVYLVPIGARGRGGGAPPAAREIRQSREQFVPHVLVVPVGTTVSFPNYDRVEHNVFSPTSPSFDLGRYNQDKKGRSHRFDDVGEIYIYCDIHKQMWARVKVVDTDPRLIARVAKDGTFTVRGVPAGKYKLHVWSYASPETVELDPIVVTDGATTTVHEQHVQLDDLGSHKRKNGTDYGVVY